MTGEQLQTLCTEVNGGASIGETLVFQLINLAKGIVEQMRPWMVLRYTDTSKTITTANTWQTAIDLSTIARLNRFYGEWPIRLFDGSTKIERYRIVKFEERLTYKDVPNTACYDEATKTLYLNGSVAFAGTLYIHHIKDSPEIDEDSTGWVFPSWSHPLLAFMAVSIHKGGIDYDDINARMAPQNAATAAVIMNRLESWDGNKQLAAIEQTDPNETTGAGYRSGAIDMHA